MKSDLAMYFFYSLIKQWLLHHIAHDVCICKKNCNKKSFVSISCHIKLGSRSGMNEEFTFFAILWPRKSI